MAKIQVILPFEVDVTQVNKTWFNYKNIKTPKLVKDQYVIGVYRRGIYNHPPVVRIIHLLDNTDESIHKALIELIVHGATIYCQKNILPKSLDEFYEIYELKEGTRVDGDLHINNLKNVWRDLKRNIKGEHVQVSSKHLQSYCSEVAWRINNAHLSPAQKLDLLISNAATGFGNNGTKRRTFKDFTK